MYRLAEDVSTISLSYSAIAQGLEQYFNQYNIQHLQGIALKNILSQLRPENIMKEVFSSFFAR